MDDVGNSLFVQHARSVGSCDTCSRNGTIVKGLRVTVKGTVDSSDDTIPLLMVTEILPDSSGCGGNLTIPSDDIVSCSSGKYINTIRAHGTLMILGWGFLLPSGVIMANLAKHMKNAFWFKYHRANQVLGLCVAFVGWVLALHEFDVFSSGTKNVPFFHGTLGIVIMSIGLLQPVYAFFRPHKHDGQPKSKSRYYWEILPNRAFCDRACRDSHFRNCLETQRHGWISDWIWNNMACVNSTRCWIGGSQEVFEAIASHDETTERD